MGSDSRSTDRPNVFLSATLEAGARSIPVRVRNFSRAGAMVEAANLPAAGARVWLKRGNLSAPGSIAWATAGRAGIRFDVSVDLQPWVQRRGHAGQQQADHAVAAICTGAATTYVGEALPPPSLPLLSEALDQICERLATAPGAPAEFTEELLKLDAVAESLRRLAKGVRQETGPRPPLG